MWVVSCQSDVKPFAGRAWINIYITPLSKNAFSRLTKEFKVLLLSVTKHCNFQGGASGQASETYPNLTSWNSLFLRIISISAWYSQEPTENPLQDRVLLHPRDSVLWKIPLSSSRLRPATKACYSWRWQIKLRFYNTEWRTLPTILAPEGNLR